MTAVQAGVYEVVLLQVVKVCESTFKSLRCCQLHPPYCFSEVLFNTFTIAVQGTPYLDRLSVPRGCLNVVLLGTSSIAVHVTEVALRHCTPCLGRLSVPRGCLDVVLLDTSSIAVHVAEVALRSWSVLSWRPVVHQLPAPFEVLYTEWCTAGWTVG